MTISSPVLMRATLPTLGAAGQPNVRTCSLTLTQSGTTEWTEIQRYFLALTIGAIGLDFVRTQKFTGVGRALMRWDLDGIPAPDPADDAEATLWLGRHPLTPWRLRPRHAHDPAIELCRSMAKSFLEQVLDAERRRECGGAICLNFRSNSAVTMVTDYRARRQPHRIIASPLIKKRSPLPRPPGWLGP